MRHGSDFCHQFVEVCITRYKWVASAENDLADVLVTSYVLQRLIPFGTTVLIVVIRKMATETVAAIYRAASGHYEQRTATVLVNDTPGGVSLTGFPQRIRAEARCFDHLLPAGENLKQ